MCVPPHIQIGILRDFNEHGGHVLLEIFGVFFISLLVAAL